MSMSMCKCPSCGVQIGITKGLSAGGHLANIVLVLLTGLLWIVPYILILACCGTTQCSKCGRCCKKF
jgi:hypothetical protein